MKDNKGDSQMETTANMIEFTLAGNWEMDTPIKELPYYVWMKEMGVKNPHTIETKLAYLASQGFVKGTHKLVHGEKILKMMGYCESLYFQWEILPKWKCVFCGTDKDIVGTLPDESCYCNRYECKQKAIEIEKLGIDKA
jgi:hypothetical protein